MSNRPVGLLKADAFFDPGVLNLAKIHLNFPGREGIIFVRRYLSSNILQEKGNKLGFSYIQTNIFKTFIVKTSFWQIFPLKTRWRDSNVKMTNWLPSAYTILRYHTADWNIWYSTSQDRQHTTPFYAVAEKHVVPSRWRIGTLLYSYHTKIFLVRVKYLYWTMWYLQCIKISSRNSMAC